jgi:hypothetical protein
VFHARRILRVFIPTWRTGRIVKANPVGPCFTGSIEEYVVMGENGEAQGGILAFTTTSRYPTDVLRARFER